MSLVFHDALLVIDSLAGLVTYLTVLFSFHLRLYAPEISVDICRYLQIYKISVDIFNIYRYLLQQISAFIRNQC